MGVKSYLKVKGNSAVIFPKAYCPCKLQVNSRFYHKSFPYKNKKKKEKKDSKMNENKHYAIQIPQISHELAFCFKEHKRISVACFRAAETHAITRLAMSIHILVNHLCTSPKVDAVIPMKCSESCWSPLYRKERCMYSTSNYPSIQPYWRSRCAIWWQKIGDFLFQYVWTRNSILLRQLFSSIYIIYKNVTDASRIWVQVIRLHWIIILHKILEKLFFCCLFSWTNPCLHASDYITSISVLHYMTCF